MKQSIDAIILGGGLAGMHLALRLYKEGKSFIVINKFKPHCASRVAAGLINPITGRRFAKTWMYEELLPVFLEEYKYWEEQCNSAFFKEINIYRAITDHRLVNDLDAKLSNAENRDFCRSLTSSELLQLQSQFQFPDTGYVFKGYQLNTIAFLKAGQEFLQEKGHWFEDDFSIAEIDLSKSEHQYGDYTTSNIIVAQGAEAIHNPLFNWAGFNINKGEILKITSSSLEIPDIVKQRLFVIPEQDQFWVGTFNSWDCDSEVSSLEGKSYLIKHLDQMMVHPYEIKEHIAANRPAIVDRRPVLGKHPLSNSVSIFNGFGSKGSSMIPYFAQSLYNHLFQGESLSDLIDVSRFW